MFKSYVITSLFILSFNSDIKSESKKNDYQRCIAHYQNDLGIELEDCEQYCVKARREDVIIEFARKYPDLLASNNSKTVKYGLISVVSVAAAIGGLYYKYTSK